MLVEAWRQDDLAWSFLRAFAVARQRSRIARHGRRDLFIWLQQVAEFDGVARHQYLRRGGLFLNLKHAQQADFADVKTHLLFGEGMLEFAQRADDEISCARLYAGAAPAIEKNHIA